MRKKKEWEKTEKSIERISENSSGCDDKERRVRGKRKNEKRK